VARQTVDEEVGDLLSVRSDIELARLKAEIATLKRQYRAAAAIASEEKSRADSMASLAKIKSKKYPRRKRSGTKDRATAVVLLSDWHVEERVRGETIGHVNDFSLDVADERIAELSDRIEMLVSHERQIANIDRIVIWAGGDFISNNIHEDTAEVAQLPPAEAMRWAGERLRGIIDRAADIADEVLVVTSGGNHGRSVMKPRIATEADHSWEQNCYVMMATFETRPNVRWQIGEGYLNVVDLDGFKIAFHHGHGIKGNIHVGASKAIAQWQRVEPVNMHCFGHHHQFAYQRGKYLSNGSLVGYNAYALRIRADFEAPCQALAVICHRRNECTKAIPIFCDKDLQEKTRCQRSKAVTSRASKTQTRSSATSSRRETRLAKVRTPAPGSTTKRSSRRSGKR
jgi:predicted phosphodiesterase